MDDLCGGKMSRYHPKDAAAPILRAASHWKRVALIEDGSVFSDTDVWTAENVHLIDQFFVQNPDLGEGNFLE